MTPSSASPGDPRPADAASDLAAHEARAGELIGWLRLISAPNRSGEVSVNREDAVALLGVLDGLRVQRAAADTEIARRDETIEQLRHELASAEATIQFLDGITPAAPSLPIPTDQED